MVCSPKREQWLSQVTHPNSRKLDSADLYCMLLSYLVYMLLYALGMVPGKQKVTFGLILLEGSSSIISVLWGFFS